jgi:hypothetical protein
MKRLKLLGLAVFAVFALSACAAATASAETSFLPEGTEAVPVKFKATSGAGKLTTKEAEIACLSDSSSGEITSKRLGKFEVEFKDCEEPKLKVKCSSLEHTPDSVGILSWMGEFHLRMGLTSQPLGIVALLILHVHVLCSILLLLILGCMAGSITPINGELTKTATISFKVKGGAEKNINEITTVDNEAETEMETCKLTVEQGGVSSQAGDETTEELEKFEKGGVATNILIMI